MTAITPVFVLDFGALTLIEQSLSQEELARQDGEDNTTLLTHQNLLTQAYLLHKMVSKIVSLTEPNNVLSLWCYRKRVSTLLGRIAHIHRSFPNIHFNPPRLYSEVMIGKSDHPGFLFPLLIAAQIIEQTIAIRMICGGDLVGEMYVNRVYSKPGSQELKPEHLFDGEFASSSALRFKITCTLPHKTKPIAKLLSQIVKEIFFREKEERVEVLTGMWESDVFFAERFKLVYADDFQRLAQRYHQAQMDKLPFAEGPGPDNMIFYKNVKEKVENPVLYGQGPIMNPYFYRNLRSP